MSTELKMPALSPTMEMGTLARWLVTVGDVVKPGDLLAEIETDKATMEFEAVDEGRITSIVFPAGSEDIAVGAVIALLSGTDEVVADAAAHPAPGIREVLPAAAVESGRFMITHEAISAPSARHAPANRANVTPLAQRLAKAKRLDLGDIVGSGRDGRIMLADLALRPVGRALAPATTSFRAAPGAAPPPSGVPLETIALSTMRRTMARRMSESKQTVPHFYLSVHCAIDRLQALRNELNASLAPRDIKLSVNDLLLKVMALAMEREPDVNVQFAGDAMHRFQRIDLSMAVAIEGGLITLVIHDVGNLSLSAIAGKSRALAARARQGALKPEEYQGGTASLSNLGMFGIDEMIPVINPPQALILGVGAGREMPGKVDGDIVFATIITATASFDHRVIDGATAARFMAAVRETLENPMLLLA